MKKIDPWLVATAHEDAVKHLKQQRDDAIEDAKDWKAEALKWKAHAASLGFSLCAERFRPDSEGWWWRLYNGKNGPEWDIGEARVIYWEESAEPKQERLLAWTSGGCWTRCDKINAPRDSGTRWFKQEPPIIRHNVQGHAPGEKGTANE